MKRRRKTDSAWPAIRDGFLAANRECEACGGESEVAHHYQNRGMGMKDHRFLQALCDSCHRELHDMGVRTFWARHGRAEGEE